MKIIKAFFIAFSLYSKIPVPQFEWKEEEMKYMLCFFPWVGAVIGGCVFLWGNLCSSQDIGTLCYALIGTALPILITGGFHVDGFMDTMDAFHSYQPKEKKLEILKDAHIGAFAAIMLVTYVLIYLGAFSELQDTRLLAIVCAGFVLSRCLSGISVVSFPPAKKEGMLYFFASSSQKRIVKGALYLQGILCIAFMLWQSLCWGAIVTVSALFVFGYYYYRTKKELGGITGDTAGYFVLLCEGCMVVTAAGISILS
ncbi:MAG: adenosylcobinamide-GDP ribazoletransferase [Lachnospiraceae bacterium]|nr:adenosylcobinamide-GDP ribazoletransferase [Lachnospiraceae bacterium]